MVGFVYQARVKRPSATTTCVTIWILAKYGIVKMIAESKFYIVKTAFVSIYCTPRIRIFFSFGKHEPAVPLITNTVPHFSGNPLFLR